MSSRLTLKWALGLTLCFFSLSGIAQAGPYSFVIAYGDSLSDNGNLFHLVGLPGFPYYMGRRSDGPVAVEKLADIFGAPLVDFAWLGATSGIGNILDGGTPTSLGSGPLPGMLTEFDMTKATLAPYLPGGLFVVWGGPDDFLSPSPGDTPLDTLNRAVSNELALVNGLKLLGAQYILAPGMPDLGLTPFYRGQGLLAAAQASAASDAYNAALLSNLPSGVFFYDTAGLLRSMVANPAAFGFGNVTDPCFDEVAHTLCGNPSQYLFFDSFHPTTAAYGFAAAGFAAAVPAPEPSSLVLSSVGFAMCAVLWRSRKKLHETSLTSRK